jgi:hypothetical protein
MEIEDVRSQNRCGKRKQRHRTFYQHNECFECTQHQNYQRGNGKFCGDMYSTVLASSREKRQLLKGTKEAEACRWLGLITTVSYLDVHIRATSNTETDQNTRWPEILRHLMFYAKSDYARLE